MSTFGRSQDITPTVPATGHRGWGLVVVAISAIVAVLDGVFFLVVRRVELSSVVSDTTYGAYLILALVYLAASVAFAVLDRRWVWIAGAVLQVAVIGLFVVFGFGLLGPGQFDYDVLMAETPLALWAGVITGLQLVMLGVTAYVAVSERPRPRAA